VATLAWCVGGTLPPAFFSGRPFAKQQCPLTQHSKNTTPPKYDKQQNTRRNTTRHLEAWYGIMGLGAVCHTLNPRLAARDIAWIAAHAGDEWLLADVPFLGLAAEIAPHVPTLKGIILLTDRQHMPRRGGGGGGAGAVPALPAGVQLLCYEALLDGAVDRLPGFRWPRVSEDAPCGLCYTSGAFG
jgi:fatty-acyl-CoA synthase